MNSRLVELYRSCRPKEALAVQEEYGSADVLLGSEVEKFAQLIVRECIQVAIEQKQWVEKQQPTFNYDDDKWDRARIQQSQHIVDKIKQHFGVES